MSTLNGIDKPQAKAMFTERRRLPIENVPEDQQAPPDRIALQVGLSISAVEISDPLKTEEEIEQPPLMESMDTIQHIGSARSKDWKKGPYATNHEEQIDSIAQAQNQAAVNRKRSTFLTSTLSVAQPNDSMKASCTSCYAETKFKAISSSTAIGGTSAQAQDTREEIDRKSVVEK